MASRLAKLGATALRIYTCHILVFSAGAIAGAVLGLSVSQAVFIAMLKQRGLL